MSNIANPAASEDRELVALFTGLDTPSVSDAMDKLGLHGQTLGIMPLADYAHPVVGPAFTVKYVPAAVPPGTVGIGTVRVQSRDIVVADANGVVIVPRDRASEVAETARKIEEVEAAIRAQIAEGATIREARAALNYHTLQRRG